ncbi:anaerobic sulfatase maturase [Vibrio hannami]
MRESCHVMAKPTGSVCNLDCKYCFYLEKEKLYPERNSNWKMSDETLELYIKQFIDAQITHEVVFSWQGGEPTLAGIDFFRKAVALQNKYRGSKSILNAFQTNAILLDDEWCEFFNANNFLIGVSIDGTEQLHNHYRVNRSGKPTFDKVMKGISYLRKHGIEFNTLTVVNDVNVKQPLAVYEFLKSLGTDYFQFIPLVERKSNTKSNEELQLVSPDYDFSASVTSWSVKPDEFGRFLVDIFDEWVRNDVGKYSVQMFDSTLSSWLGIPASLCIFSETCGSAFAMEANGDMYACDHYVYPDYKLGNIHDISIREINNGAKAIEFGDDKRDQISNECHSCKFRFACHGGCPKHRFSQTKSTKKYDLSYFCKSYKMFFKHSEEPMKLMSSLARNNMSISEVMNIMQKHDMASMKKSIGRNDSCYCGSGKKYKNCCMK